MWIVDTNTGEYVDLDATDNTRYLFSDTDPSAYVASIKTARKYLYTFQQVIDGERENAILETDFSMDPDDKAVLVELDNAVSRIVDDELFDVSAGHECLACGLTGVHRQDCAGMAMVANVGVSTWF